MNNDRIIVVENVGTGTIGLADTQGHMHRIIKGGKMRISAMTLQDILDHPGSKIIFKEGMAKVSNISKKDLFNMGLNEAEVNFFIKDELIEEPEEEKVEEVKEETAPVEEPEKEEPAVEPEQENIEEPVVAEEPKEEIKPAKIAKKPTKKTTKKSSSKRK